MSLTKEDKGILRTMLELKSLLCALCLYMEDGRKANTALTVIRGYAVCEDHLGYVAQGEEWFVILRAARREEPEESE